MKINKIHKKKKNLTAGLLILPFFGEVDPFMESPPTLTLLKQILIQTTCSSLKIRLYTISHGLTVKYL